MRWTVILLALFLFPRFLSAAEEISRSGTEVKELACFDRHITELMKKYELPGGTAAVAKDGRLVYARGFGWADRKNGVPMQPMALMRIASVSKPFTAAVILRLVEQGRLKLSDPILPYLKKFGAETEKHLDPRWRRITIERLLRHTAGFDRGKVSIRCSSRSCPNRRSVRRGSFATCSAGRWITIPARYVYSNFDYCILGRVIEALTGKKYEDAVREMVLRPAGITRMKLGRTRLANRAAGEVVYHTLATDQRYKSVFPEEKQLVEEPYGEFYLEALDAHGGWIASAADLVRFAATLDGQRPTRILKPESIAKTESLSDPPIYLANNRKDRYYGLGWVIVSQPQGKYWFHDGLLAGTRTLLIRYRHGIVMTLLFNGQTRDVQPFFAEFGQTLVKAADEVKHWPRGDLFSQKPYSE